MQKSSIGRDPKEYCSDIHTVKYLREMYAEGVCPLHVTVINNLHSDPFIPPTVKTSRGRRRKNRIESQSIVVSNCRKPGLLFAHYVTPKDILDTLV